MVRRETSRLTRILFQLHLWGGLLLGLYVCLIGLTGSILVFREEIAQHLSPTPRIGVADNVADIDRIRAGIQAHYPEWHPWSLEVPWDAGHPWTSYLLQPGGGKAVYADATGQVIGEDRTVGTWLQVVQQFHSFLLLPRGRLLNGLAGLVLVLLALSGLVLWWPERGTWQSAFRIVRRSNWKGVVFDLHRVTGVVTLGFVLLFAVTGAYFTWPGAYRALAAALLPTKPASPQVAPAGTDESRLPLADLVAAAERAIPDTRLVRILVPEGQRQPITVVVAHGNAPLDRQTRTSQLTVDSQTGDVLAIDDYRQRRLGDDVVAWIGPLHSGHFGGMTVRIVWAIAGLAFPALFVTGFLMWNNRVLAPWLRRRGSTARDATPGL